MVTTHDLEKVLAHADRLVFMRGGQSRMRRAAAGADRAGGEPTACAARGRRGSEWRPCRG
ncbi:MAG: hypothetical protein MZV70_18965 [Desulfobacterales bacterium]|nr:hypothetical protein [Desulfobacterales bacterium]